MGEKKSSFPFLLFCVVLTSNILVVFLGFHNLVLGRNHAVEFAAMQTRNLAQAIDQSISVLIKRIDHTLVTVTRELEMDLASGSLNIHRLKHLITTQESLVPESVAVRVTNQEGIVIIGNDDQSPAVSLADRPFFPALRDNPNAGIFINKPIIGRFTKKWVIVSVRRYNHPDGSFAGVVAVSVLVEHFQKLLARFDIGTMGTLVLRDRDGGLITRRSLLSEKQAFTIGEDNISAELREIARSGVPMQTFFTQVPFDKTYRTTTYRRLEIAPMMVLAGLAEVDYLAQWYKDRNATVGVISVFSLLTWLMFWLLWQMWKRRERDATALQESQQRLSEIFTYSADAIFSLTQAEDGRFLFASFNPAAERVSGRRSDEVLGKTPEEVFPPELASAFLTNYRRCAVSGLPLTAQEVIPWPSGIHYFETILSPIRGKDGRVQQISGFSRDITGRRRAEEEKEKLQTQLLQAQKMEAIGLLAGGVAHDFNNMLQVILGHVQLGMLKADSSSDLQEHLAEIQKSAQRSADLTRQLLAYARKQTIHPKTLDLNVTITAMISMLRRLIREDIELCWAPNPDVWKVRMDPTQIDQILANLAVNARDAISGVGRVTIELRNVVVDKANADLNPGSSPGDHVLLVVSDTGKGMDEETQKHLFEPFFTTKEVGKGTGLGLATVFGVVTQNHGFINVVSEKGQGTTFRIFLPRSQAPEKSTVVSREGLNLRGTETILLVEDEVSIMKMGCTILQQMGYSVHGSDRPTQALNHVQNCSGPIHLLITDVIMPEMNGMELKTKVLGLKPGIKCLFISGYPAEVMANQGIIDDGESFLQKPFSSESLAKKVREILDRGN